MYIRQVGKSGLLLFSFIPEREILDEENIFLGEGVFLYAEPEKVLSAKRNTSFPEREILDEEGFFSGRRRMYIRQATKKVLFGKRSAQGSYSALVSQ